MKLHSSAKELAFLAGVLALAVAVVVGAQSGGRFEITTSTIDSGGAASASGGFALEGTIGQPEPGLSQGGSFLLQGGFWSRDTPGAIFSDSFEGTGN